MEGVSPYVESAKDELPPLRFDWVSEIAAILTLENRKAKGKDGYGDELHEKGIDPRMLGQKEDGL